MLMESISKRFKDHYESKFAEFGASPLGVDWGKEEELLLRYRKMLSVMRPQADTTASMLDVGCGYGGLFDYALVHGVGVDYTGIDVAANMIEHAKEHHQDGVFHSGDVLHYPFDRRFDYVVCNGILTQKLETKIREMDHFCNALVRRMFDLCDIGLAFNIMSNKVNFVAENLYYRSPVEMLSFCLDNFSSKVRIDHAYPLFEYTVYVYKD